MTTHQNNIVISNHASREQLEQIYDLLGEVFPIEREYFQTRLDFDSTYDPETTWFATVDGQIASNVQIFPLNIRVGQSVLKVGGMGSVGTHPNYRGMGLAHRILNAQTEWMKQNEYDLSLLLASKHAFYEKVGWKLIPENLYTIEAPTALPSLEGYEIIPFEPQHLEQLRFIYEQFNEKRTYTVVRDDVYWDDIMQWPDWTQSDCLLLRKNDKIVAYGIIERHDKENVWINEFVYLQEAGDAVIDLFLALCQLRTHAKYILARLPDDHRLIDYFDEQGANMSELNISMWKIINFEATFHKLQPELQTRLNNNKLLSHENVHLELQCGDERIYLNYEQQQLLISSEPGQANTYQHINVDERKLIAYIIFGYFESTEAEEGTNLHNHLQDDEQTDHTASILEALFPKQNAVFYLTDKF